MTHFEIKFSFTEMVDFDTDSEREVRDDSDKLVAEWSRNRLEMSEKNFGFHFYHVVDDKFEQFNLQLGLVYQKKISKYQLENVSFHLENGKNQDF